jgi:DNA-binding NtrC family response regulator
MSKARILVVDDDRDMVAGIVDLLEFNGYLADAAYSGSEAATAYRREPYDVVVMDIRMPNINGVECQAMIQSMDPSAKIIMMTGHSKDRLLQQADDQGALEILRKPFDFGGLLRQLEKLTQKEILPARGK